MAGLTNKEIWKMSIVEADAYIEKHPDEAWRFAMAYGESAVKQAKKSIEGCVLRRRQP